jgi:hypothetical protein
MGLKVEWRTNGEFDAVLVVDEGDEGDQGAAVRQALIATPELLTRLLTDLGDLASWTGGRDVDALQRQPEAWGQLIIARASSGEVLWVDPERFWGGISTWFRSRGVDYDTEFRRLAPGLAGAG